ncbi:MAG TPA: LpxA family transferase [Ohtaekwangia sp.]
MIRLTNYIPSFVNAFPHLENTLPWKITETIVSELQQKMKALGHDFVIRDSVAIHKTAVVEEHVVLKGPVIISAGCFIGAHAYLRGGVFLDENVNVGPGCEVKSSIILSRSALAHFNFVGDSIVGSGVNMEAGSIIANHYNERKEKNIDVLIQQQRYATGSVKFGALVGDGTKIGANAVLSPGTILQPQSVVKRLELVEQVKYIE